MGISLQKTKNNQTKKISLKNKAENQLNSRVKKRVKFNSEPKKVSFSGSPQNMQEWDEAQVWEWLSQKIYSKTLKKLQWEFIDGATLMELDYETAASLQVPKRLIPRIIKDVKAEIENPSVMTVTPDLIGDEDLHSPKKKGKIVNLNSSFKVKKKKIDLTPKKKKKKKTPPPKKKKKKKKKK